VYHILEQLEVVAVADYGDENLFAELAKLQGYYYEWRRDHIIINAL